MFPPTGCCTIARMTDPEALERPDDTTYLRALSERFPDADAALAEILHLHAVLTLPCGTVHVVSDVHGEWKKLRHILANASGSLRPLVEATLAPYTTERERLDLLALIYYPREAWVFLSRDLDAVPRRELLQRSLHLELAVLRALAQRYSLRQCEKAFPPRFRLLFQELVMAPELGRTDAYLDAMLTPFLSHDRAVDLLRMVAHVIRGLSVSELIVAGDLGDRGPRIDKVIDGLMHQPTVSITWGNHDCNWLAACLGHPAAIATVARISLRYGRLAQLEEGYGIPIEHLERLARAAYGDDPAERFVTHPDPLRDPLLMARMQKAALVLQCKLEAQAIARNPAWNMGNRRILHTLDPVTGTVTVDGKLYPSLDLQFPTVDPSDPYALSPAEQLCMDGLTAAFLESTTLWDQMRFVARKGTAWLRRDDVLIFHGCVPVDDAGGFLPMPIDGRALQGRPLMDAIAALVQRSMRARSMSDLDTLYYLWTGPRSPMFGKDRMATLESHLIADKNPHTETKNPYFKLLHEPWFCQKIAVEFGVDPARVLIVNGHVPVKVEAGESPLKRSGMAVTIDGAFSEAYGDRGYTLVLDADRVYLAQHHHFDSVDEAITHGADIIPTVETLRTYAPPRCVGDTERGTDIRREIALLERLVHAFGDNTIPER